GYGHPLPDFSAIHTLSGSAQKLYSTSRSRLQNRENLCVLDQALYPLPWSKTPGVYGHSGGGGISFSSGSAGQCQRGYPACCVECSDFSVPGVPGYTTGKPRV